ncbi:hypothetical protein [Nostoc sp.]|uniref:hypothetical protein n=1 Tax=Nostoc sp. TaxID=1180 RepID=UPI002FFD1407
MLETQAVNYCLGASQMCKLYQTQVINYHCDRSTTLRSQSQTSSGKIGILPTD